jgi:hypothetical protein
MPMLPSAGKTDDKPINMGFAFVEFENKDHAFNAIDTWNRYKSILSDTTGDSEDGPQVAKLSAHDLEKMPVDDRVRVGQQMDLWVMPK